MLIGSDCIIPLYFLIRVWAVQVAEEADSSGSPVCTGPNCANRAKLGHITLSFHPYVWAVQIAEEADISGSPLRIELSGPNYAKLGQTGPYHR